MFKLPDREPPMQLNWGGPEAERGETESVNLVPIVRTHRI